MSWVSFASYCKRRRANTLTTPRIGGIPGPTATRAPMGGPEPASTEGIPKLEQKRAGGASRPTGRQV
jgi:hypothetical protein